MQIRRNIELCHGCRACQLMCSFHHHGIVSPEGSSIQVIRNNAKGNIRWNIDETCDLCKGETEVLCVKYCPYGALEKQSP